jgi:hypothetical protein
MNYEQDGACHQVTFTPEEVEEILTEYALYRKGQEIPDQALVELEGREKPGVMLVVLNDNDNLPKTVTDHPVGVKLRWTDEVYMARVKEMARLRKAEQAAQAEQP